MRGDKHQGTETTQARWRKGGDHRERKRVLEIRDQVVRFFPFGYLPARGMPRMILATAPAVTSALTPDPSLLCLTIFFPLLQSF